MTVNYYAPYGDGTYWRNITDLDDTTYGQIAVIDGKRKLVVGDSIGELCLVDGKRLYWVEGEDLTCSTGRPLFLEVQLSFPGLIANKKAYFSYVSSSESTSGGVNYFVDLFSPVESITYFGDTFDSTLLIGDVAQRCEYRSSLVAGIETGSRLRYVREKNGDGSAYPRILMDSFSFWFQNTTNNKYIQFQSGLYKDFGMCVDVSGKDYYTRSVLNIQTNEAYAEEHIVYRLNPTMCNVSNLTNQTYSVYSCTAFFEKQ